MIDNERLILKMFIVNFFFFLNRNNPVKTFFCRLFPLFYRKQEANRFRLIIFVNTIFSNLNKLEKKIDEYP